MQKRFNCLLVVLFLFVGTRLYAQHDKLAGVFSITACPAENCENSINFSWATDTTIKRAVVEIAPASDKEWKKSVFHIFDGTLCTTFDNVYSKSANGENFYENVVINKYNATVGKLKRDTRYKYRIYPAWKYGGSDVLEIGQMRGKYHSSVRYFKTAGAKEWEACIISDFHVYSPLYGRTKSAMDMISVVENFAFDGKSEKASFPLDWILHLGDITAWGGSYSFWQNMYKEMPFRNYMWAGVNGNHDNMTRGYDRTTNEFFRDAAAYPMNG
ncbi:MAG: fibronectin type III domain-containing protein, partial [Bacteroidales bacterium]|nr:fibronectin type III domain-containing protein [Bacteroidales bacterium]